MKRKFELGRAPAMTKIGEKRIHEVRTRGGNVKHRALRLDHGSFSWASEGVSRPTRVVDVVYNASNNELVRTKTLVKGAIIQIDATPFRQWYVNHYGNVPGRKKGKALTKDDEEALNKPKSRKVLRKIDARKAEAKIDAKIDEQFLTGRLFGELSRPNITQRGEQWREREMRELQI